MNKRWSANMSKAWRGRAKFLEAQVERVPKHNIVATGEEKEEQRNGIRLQL